MWYKPEMEGVPCVYVIRHCASGMVKIGRTEDLGRRQLELRAARPGDRCALVDHVTQFRCSHLFERNCHLLLDEHRLPQSEWFHVDVGRALDAVAWALTLELTAMAEQHAEALERGHTERSEATGDLLSDIAQCLNWRAAAAAERAKQRSPASQG